MKRRVTIQILLLFLVFRQGLPDIGSGQSSLYYSDSRETYFIIDSSRFGLIEDNVSGDPEYTAPALPVFHHEEHLLGCAVVRDHFKYFFFYHPNPLLIDRPPPENPA